MGSRVAVRTYREAVDIAVLGPLRVTGGGGPVEIRGAKERVLLAVLVAHAPRAVPVGSLVEALWPDEPPRTAAKSLQTYVLRLRNAIEPDRSGSPTLLVTEGAGYRLALTPDHTDAGRFERLVAAAAQAPPAERAPMLREALDLWRGRAYADLDSAPALAAEATRLEQLRLGALEERFAAELELGRHRAVVPELERLVAAHPLRERAWGLLVTGLYRDGRQADALGAYERARRVLADELGIDPGPELRSLHARVLAQDPTLDRVVVELPDALRDPGTPMLGRERELEALREAWRATEDGSSRRVLLRGPVGAGARRLASALAAEVAAMGHPVAWVDADGERGGSGAGRTLVVRGRGAPVGRAGPGLEIHLAGPDEEASGTVVDLGPLDAAALRELVAGHVGEVDLDDAAATVRERSGGWPGRAHAAARSWQRDAARASVRVAAAEVDDSTARLREARRRLTDGVLDLQGEPGPPPDRSRCPWPGLASYDVADGPWFAGRERLVAELVARVTGSPFLAVVGASGSGKSSLVRAGLLAALADDALPGSAGWTHLVLRPGPHPMRELAHRVLGARRPDRGAILEGLVRDGEPGDHTVLVVDQAEELWTVCADAGEREAFLDTLVDVVGDPGSGVTVVLALRADFLDRLAGHAAMTALVGDHAVLVGPPHADDVRRAAERPARRAGLTFDVGLLDAIVQDAGSEPGLLPLLSTSLAQLWEARDADRLTFAGYVGSGGLKGAIGHLAEQAWGELPPDDQEAAKAVLLRLAGPGEGIGVARRRVPLAELEALPASRAGVVQRLADARLLTLSEGHTEVAHEALFREWPRLRGWLTEDAAGRAVQRRLAVASAEWAEEDREPGLLWRGARLEAGLDVAALRPEEVTATEREFLDAGAAAVDAERREVQERAASEARQNRRLRGLLAGAVVLLLVAALAGAVALVARDRADAAADEAEQAAVTADARRLAASALNVEYPDLALLTAVEATRLEQSPETYGALLTLLARQPDVVTAFRTPDRFLRNAASPDGRTVYASENEPVLHALDATTGEELWRTEVAGQVGSIAPSPDGRVVAAVVFADGHDEVALLDPVDGETLATIRPRDFVPAIGRGSAPFLGYNAGWTGDGRLVAGNDLGVFTADARGRVLDGRRWPTPQPDPFGLTVWPDGRVSATAADLGASTVVDLDGGPVQRTRGWIAAVSPDGGRALEVLQRGATGQAARVLDGRTLEAVGPTWPLEGFVLHARFSPDGERVALGVDEEVLLRDGRRLAPLSTLLGHSGSVMSVAWAGPDHDLLWTAGRDGRAVGFDTTGRRGVIGEVATPPGTHSGETAGSGDVIFTDFNDTAPNRAYLRPRGERRATRLPVGVPGCVCQAQATELTPDGATAAVGYLTFDPGTYDVVPDVGHVVIHDGDTGAVDRVVDTPWPVAGLGATPDGRSLVVSGERGWGVLDLATGELTLHDLPPLDLPSADGTALVEVAPGGDRAVLLRDTDLVVADLVDGTAATVRRLPDDHRAMSAAWGGDRLAVGTIEGWLYVLDAATLDDAAPRRLITGGFVTDVETAPDGRTAATIGSDGDVLLWDTASWRPYGEPVLDDRGWGFLSFSSDSSELHVDLEEGRRATIDVLPADWVAAACAAANRDLTADESAIVRPGEPVRPTCD